jgi:DNA repair protein RecO (recombination protein O)
VSQVVTEAIVLHAFDYRETSRILRLATRDAGVRSVIARGARRSKERFGAAIDLFAEGSARISLHASGDLHTLVSFDVSRSREALAGDWTRFSAANALSEIMLRFARDDVHAELFDAYAHALDSLAGARPRSGDAVGLGGAWRLVAELGFAPALDSCASCGAPIAPEAAVHFSHRAGGALCARCAAQVPSVKPLPPDARADISAWLEGREAPAELDELTVRAHLRLLRQFLMEHLADDRPLRAFAVWERNDWGAVEHR